MLIANNGVIMRQKVGKISDQSRQATGVRVQRLDQGTHIREVALVSAEAVEDEALVTSTTSEPAKEPGTPPGTHPWSDVASHAPRSPFQRPWAGPPFGSPPLTSSMISPSIDATGNPSAA
mgnify:CR=1 FL=1